MGGVARRWVTSAWQNLGTTANVVSLDTRGARPVAATRAVSGTSATATVLEWDGSSSWVALGASITGEATGSQGIAVAADAGGHVFRCANGIVARYNR